MPSLWFVVPVHGRLQLAEICLRQLRRTCDTLLENGIAASAVIVTDEEHHEQLPDLGFAKVVRDNTFVSRRFNDGLQLATDPAYNPHPADYVVPCGSDDWVDHRLFLEPLPAENTIVGFQRMSFVREDGREMVTGCLDYVGGSGIRIIPRQLLEPLGYRPADEDRCRGCDTSILTNIRIELRDTLKVEHWHLHDAQIVDWKTAGGNLNPYDSIARVRQCETTGDPFTALAGVYPAEALEEMLAYYQSVAQVAA